MLISLVVPCFNEEDILERFHERVTDEMTRLGHAFQLVYVDDGSADRTLPILQELAAADPRARYVSFSRNFGKEAAMLAGLQHAEGDAVVIMDADLQHPPELVGRMLQEHAQGYDQVIARRTRKGDRVTRTLTARAYYWLINRLVDVELVDGVGDFRLLSRRAADAVLELTEYNRFSKGLFAWVGFPTTTFSYENAVREQGRSAWTFGKLLNYGLDGLLSFNNKPLRAALYLGMLLMSLAFVYAAWIVGVALVKGVDTPGYVTLLVVLTALAGVQMVMVGVVGEYVGRIYYEVKRRPHFLVKATNTRAHRPAQEPEPLEFVRR
ncbi:glycosyltransferase family 2 protein [Streptomyces poriferorum]|uniref:Glycosyltransferase family 2 protein n=1 Tax=Streptomyces poriferorum TaxID=2798799 RepID=A0ABY9ITG0_9ACTN|nr:MULTISPECIES: glycosyltransferase family 2 protein [unclassified Streptomyces]MDP5312419.1 glycosyltransferase family 2 protein [Streptomyces sp. Alt4]WLQ48778.1 glycosyltransferase family 2 protein [Streptomyces sp. Alt1]WLQ58545.1 glycosyltransferase family 2 protein [Streptomyces sp. Alt2]